MLLQFAAGFLIGLSGALIPGPLLAFVVADTLRKNWGSGFLAAAGHCLIESLMMLAIFGLAVVWSPRLSGVAGTVGGGILVVIGVIMLRATLGRFDIGEGRGGHGSVAGGVIFTAFNPTWVIWWPTIGFTQLTYAISTASVTGGLVWCLGHFCADLGWYGFVSTSVSQGKRWIGTR
ncbi:TPA: hypothetical protein EYP44_02840, partial [Candidatus Bathyarchaeota archaeon]|nr:hypothetical protein [Candidatus Bathyarchaeota archaeon]